VRAVGPNQVDKLNLGLALTGLAPTPVRLEHRGSAFRDALVGDFSS
jgi:hypothetical protein